MAACTGSKISPDLTGASEAQNGEICGPTTVQNAKQRGYGVVFSHRASPLKAGDDLGGHRHRAAAPDAGRRKELAERHTARTLSDWSKITLIEASHFDPAVAYAAVDRHRLDDQSPYLFRTRDYGKTWQPISAELAMHSFLNAIREDTQKKGYSSPEPN